MQTQFSILQQKEYLTFLSLALSCSPGCLLPWPDWPVAPPECWPEELAAKVLKVAVVLGGGLGGTKHKGEPWPWLVPLWWLEDWELPWCPTPPWSLGLAPLDSAWTEVELPPWAVCWCPQDKWSRRSCYPELLRGSFLCFSLSGEHGSSLDPD